MPTGIYKRTQEHKNKLRNLRLGKAPWNKGKKLGFIPSCAYKKGHIPWSTGKKLPHSIEWKKNMSERLKGHIVSEETRLKISIINSKPAPWLAGEKSYLFNKFGENHPRWIKDRTKLKKSNRKGDTAFREWRMNVYRRDNFKCKIFNQDCVGRIEAHHILRWADHPELRYEINNGITLCHFHHPRKRQDEINLSPYFKDLISKR